MAVVNGTGRRKMTRLGFYSSKLTEQLEAWPVSVCDLICVSTHPLPPKVKEGKQSAERRDCTNSSKDINLRRFGYWLR